MSSVSPSGTRSKLLYPRVIDSITGFKNFTDWAVTSLHYWGENPVGQWNIIIKNTRKDRKAREGKMWYNGLFITSGPVKLDTDGPEESDPSTNRFRNCPSCYFELYNVNDCPFIESYCSLL